MKTLESEADSAALAFATNIVYARYGQDEVVLHLITSGLAVSQSGYEPVGERVPLVIYVPGSAWFPQNLDRSVPTMIDFARQTGYAVAIVAYRPSTVAKSPAQLIDIKTSIRFMRANAERYNIDPRKVAIWGTSSGGHMASLVGLTGELVRFVTDDHRDQSSQVSAVVDFFGPTDFRRMADFPSVMDHDDPASPESTVIGGPIQDPANRKKVEEYNPVSYVSGDRSLPPFLIMHGDQDPLVPFNQSVLLYEALRDAGQRVEFYKLRGAGHGNRFFTPATMAIVRQFLAENLR